MPLESRSGAREFRPEHLGSVRRRPVGSACHLMHHLIDDTWYQQIDCITCRRLLSAEQRAVLSADGSFNTRY